MTAHSKGKLERWHKTFRSDFCAECDWSNIRSLEDANERLWAYLDNDYHRRVHSGLDNESPIERWRKDLIHVRSLKPFAHNFDEYFYHRIKRKVRQDGTISYQSQIFEVPYELVGKQIYLVFDVEEQEGKWVEDKDNNKLGGVKLIDLIGNCHRKRTRPTTTEETKKEPAKKGDNLVDQNLEDFKEKLAVKPKSSKSTKGDK